jgi:heme exporter protein C
MAIVDLANPSRFLNLANRAIPWFGGAAVLAVAFGLNQVAAVPDDYQQGATVKIMFLHVPGAWLGMLGWAVMTVAALGTLVWRHPLADVTAKAAAPIGAAFTLMCLVTGSLWGRPMWGTYWVWDARLTSVLVLFLLYLGVIAVWRTVEDPRARRGRRPSSPSSARSTCPSSNFRSTGGTRCTSRRRCSAAAARPFIRRSSCRF